MPWPPQIIRKTGLPKKKRSLLQEQPLQILLFPPHSPHTLKRSHLQVLQLLKCAFSTAPLCLCMCCSLKRTPFLSAPGSGTQPLNHKRDPEHFPLLALVHIKMKKNLNKMILIALYFNHLHLISYCFLT
jgi:hypothetical protein